MALLFYFLLYFALAFVWRSVVGYRRTGLNPLVLATDDSAYGYLGRAFKGVIATVAVLVVLNAVDPALVAQLGTLAVLQGLVLRAIGWVLLLASLVWLITAQIQMGDSWRVGIDSKNSTALVSVGLFTVSRNPIFLAMRVNLLGLFCVLPNAFTLVVLVAGELLMQVQVRLEELHLGARHGEQYAQYKTSVRRWF